MANQTLAPGATANLGAGIVMGNLNIIGVATPYTIAIAGGPAVAHVVAVGAVDVYPINGQSVSVVNTSPAGTAPNLTLSW